MRHPGRLIASGYALPGSIASRDTVANGDAEYPGSSKNASNEKEQNHQDDEYLSGMSEHRLLESRRGAW
jgi:hypothetical protein